MRRSQPKRDWSDANEKREPVCRGCGEVCGRLELAHLIGRSADQPHPTRQGWLYVNPNSVLTLGGPATDPATCHGKQHGRRLDLLGKLTPEEEAQAVLDAEGLELARIALCPSAYPERRAA